MFYTIFTYEGSEPHHIIHEHPARPYAEDIATYPNHFTVLRKPTLEEAKVIFSVCKPSNLCAGIENAKTTELT